MIRRAFTLMEVVLALALTSVVMYLLMTAVELFMVRVDSSRGRVESAEHFLGVQGTGPGGDRRVEFLLVGDPSGVDWSEHRDDEHYV